MSGQPSMQGDRCSLEEMIASEHRGCLILVRHGETSWNAERRLQGQRDVPLNECGWHQCRAIAQLLAQVPIATIHSSVLTRCLETANEISKCNIGIPTVVPTVLLKEMALGMLEGEPKEQQSSQLATQYYKQLCADEINYRVPHGGENLRDVHRRVVAFFEDRDLLQAETAQVIVGHRNVNKMIVKHLLGLSFEDGERVEHENQRLYLFFPRSRKLWSCWVEGAEHRLQPGLATTAEVYA